MLDVYSCVCVCVFARACVYELVNKEFTFLFIEVCFPNNISVTDILSILCSHADRAELIHMESEML